MNARPLAMACATLWSVIGQGCTGETYHVAPDGDDKATGTAAAPWRTLERAAAALDPGDTLLLRAGTYREPYLHLNKSGAPGAPITIRSFPGETAILDCAIPLFVDSPQLAWVLVDERHNIYRSIGTFPDAGRVFGHFPAADGGYRLLPYAELGPMETANEDYSEDLPFYCGPGVSWNAADEHIYIRLDRGRYQARLGYSVPPDPNPTKQRLQLFTKATALMVEASHLVLEDLTIRNAGTAIDIKPGSHHIRISHCSLRAGRYEVTVRSGVHHVVFEQLHFDGGFPPWVPRSDVKRPRESRPGHDLQGAALFFDRDTSNVTVDGCTFTRLFDAIDATTNTAHLTVRRCRFDTIRDDALQLGTASHHVEFHDNVITRTAVGVSRHGSGAPPSEAVGTKYIHHNVIDTSARQLYARRDPRGLLKERWHGPDGDGMATGRAFGTHLMDRLTGPDPWKVYHNTIIGGTDVDGSGLGLSYPFEPIAPSLPHEVFNNILIQTEDHYMVQAPRVHDGSQCFDGNLYYRAKETKTGLFEDVYDGKDWIDYASLDEFRRSSQWQLTKEHYVPGWETNGVQANPQLDSAFRPSSDGPAARGAIDLSARHWPGAAAVAWRGARPSR